MRSARSHSSSASPSTVCATWAFRVSRSLIVPPGVWSWGHPDGAGVLAEPRHRLGGEDLLGGVGRGVALDLGVLDPEDGVLGGRLRLTGGGGVPERRSALRAELESGRILCPAARADGGEAGPAAAAELGGDGVLEATRG